MIHQTMGVYTCMYVCMYGEMYDTSDHGGLHMYVCMHVWRDV